MAELGTLLRSSGMYVIGNVLSRSIPFLLLPIITRYLTPTDVGTVAMFTLAVAVAQPLVGLGSDAAIGRQFFERDRIDFPNYVTNCLYIVFASTLVCGGLVWLFGTPIGRALAFPPLWLWAVLLTAIGRYLGSALQQLWQVQRRPVPYGAYSLALTATTFGLTVWLVVGRGVDWRGRVLGEMVASVLLGLVALLALGRGGWLAGGPARAPVQHALRYGLGVTPHVLISALVASTDRLLLVHFLGLGATGLYYVGAQVAMVIAFLEYSFNQALIPWQFERLRRGGPDDLAAVTRLARVYAGALLVGALLFALLAPPLLGRLVGPAFQKASEFVVWLALANALTGMYKIPANTIYFSGRTYLLSAASTLVALTNVAVIALLIRLNGAVGAAQGLAFGALLQLLLTRWAARRVLRPLVPSSAS